MTDKLNFIAGAGVMTLTGVKKKITAAKSCLSATSSTTNFTETGLDLNTGLNDDRIYHKVTPSVQNLVVKSKDFSAIS